MTTINSIFANRIFAWASHNEIIELFTNLTKERNHQILEIVPHNLKKTQLTLLCQKCNTIFKTNGFNYRRAGSQKNNVDSPYGCPTCRALYRKNIGAQNVNYCRGPNHHAWKGGKNPEKREGYDKKKYNEWKHGVTLFYKGVCFITGSREKLQAHHLESWFTDPSKRYVISNGVLITEQIHKKFHSEYGSNTNTSQFETFCIDHFFKCAALNSEINQFPWKTSNNFSKVAYLVYSRKSYYQKKMEDKIIERGHILKNGSFENRFSEFEIYCPFHNEIHVVKYHNYVRSKFGMLCCSKLKK